MRKLKEKNVSFENLNIKTFEPNCVYISNYVFEEGLDILVKTNDIVKLGQPILQKNGQNILSPIFVKVKSIKLEKNENNDLVYFVEIEKNNENINNFSNKKSLENNQNIDKIDINNNPKFDEIDQKNDQKIDEIDIKINQKFDDFYAQIDEKNAKFCIKNDENIANFYAKNDENIANFYIKNGQKFDDFYAKNDVIFNENEEWIFEKTELKNKEDLINLCKKFGLCSKENFTYKIVEKMDENLIIDAFDEKLVLNSKILLENEGEKIKNIIEELVQILSIKKVIFYCNKKLKNSAKIFANGLNFNAKKVIKTKQPKFGLTLEDLINIYNAKRQKGQTKHLVSVCGGAIKNPCILSVSFGTKIADIISFCGGFKQNIDEIEDFKYMALVAFNDEKMLKQKIKNEKTLENRQKLENMLKEKQIEAYDNIFSKIESFHEKYLECLSAVFLSKNKEKIPTKNFEFPLNIGFQGLSFLNFNEFN